MREFFGNLGDAYGLNPLCRKVFYRADTPVSAFQAFPLLHGHHDQGIATVFGDNDRFAPGLVTEFAEGLLKLA